METVPVLTVGSKNGVTLDPVTQVNLEKTQVLVAFANSEADSAAARLVEVRDEIEAITVETKRRLKALIEDKVRLENKVQSNRANSERLFALFRENLRKALLAVGVPEERVDNYQVRLDPDLRIISITEEDGPKET
jgi:hypothetical protein